MAFDMDNLGGHFGEVLRDSRPVSDPWGFGITAEILRASHIDWKTFELNLAADSPAAQKIRLVTTENAFQGMAPSGFRKEKKATAAEAHAKMVKTIAARDEVTTDVEDLRRKKHGIAAILIKAMTVHGESVVRAGGVEHHLSTIEGRESFLSHATYEFKDGAETKQRSIPVFKRDSAGEVELDDLGNPVEARWAGWNTGDGLAAWVVDESGYLAAFVDSQKADALEPSNDTSAGSIGTGSPGAPTNEES